MAELRRRRGWPPEHVALALFYVVSALAWLRTQEWPGSSLLSLAALAGIGLELDGVGERLRRRGERDGWLLAGLAVAVGAAWTLYAVVGETMLALLRGVIGSGLLLLGGTFLAGRTVWRPGRGVVPAGLGLLLLAGLDPFASLLVPAGVAAAALIAHLTLDAPARRRRESPPPGRLGPLLALLGLAAGLCACVVVLLPWAQPLVEAAVASAYGSGRAESGLSERARLGEMESLALSRSVVMRVWARQPARFRAHVLTHFDGRAWTAPNRRPAVLAPERIDGELGAWLSELPGRTFRVTGAGTGGERSRVVAVDTGRGVLVTPAGPRLVRVAGGTPQADALGTLAAPFWPPPRIYGIVHRAAGRGPLTSAERSAGLQLPDQLDPRLSDLAARLAPGGSARERVDATVGWIGRECRYALDVGTFRGDQPIAEFLFEKKRGYCEYFASAAALLLRLQGVPARYVSGYNVRDENARGDHYLVRASDAHAWIEAWLPDQGWVEIDPTPAAQYDALRAGQRDGWAARAWERLAARVAELQARLGHDWGDTLRWLGRGLAALGRAAWRHAWWVAGLVVAAAAGRALRRRLVRRRPLATGGPVVPEGVAVGADLAALVTRLERRWAEHDQPRPAQRAPLEHARALAAEAPSRRLGLAGCEIVECYYRARFAGRAASPEELARLRRALDFGDRG